MHLGGKAQVEEVISASAKAFEMTKEQSSSERASVLSRIADGISKRAEEFAKTIALEAGKPVKQARREVERGVSTFEIAAEEAKRISGEFINVDIDKQSKNYTASARRFPIGVVSAISPFNFPLNLVAHKVAPAIASGNTVVHKPASQTPFTSVLLARVIEEAGAIPGTYNLVQAKREDAEILATDERIKLLTFTGSAEVGWHLKNLAPRKKVTLELGGNAGVVVDSDCKLEWAAKRCAEGSFAYSGQICISIQRIFVVDSIFDQFTDLLLEETSKLKVGDPLSEDTFVGPMIDEANATRIMVWIDEAKGLGAKIHCGNKREKNMVWPTVLSNVKPSCKISSEEAFGPVVVVGKCSNFIDGIRKVNDSKFGLQASIFTYDIRKIENAYRNIDVGGLIVNDYPTFRQDNYPYGGVKESGVGREGIKFAIEEMTELKTLVINFNK
jgi:acyl-CoA reductase-like NAD-dependent aldehyde dehydrogenase